MPGSTEEAVAVAYLFLRAKQNGLDVRTVEKALFKKNLDES